MIGNYFIFAIYTSHKITMMILQSFLLLTHKAVSKVKYKNYGFLITSLDFHNKWGV